MLHEDKYTQYPGHFPGFFKHLLRVFATAWLLLLSLPSAMQAEGTKQLAPAPIDMAMLLIGDAGFGRFASYHAPENRRFYFPIHHTGEVADIGLWSAFTACSAEAELVAQSHVCALVAALQGSVSCDNNDTYTADDDTYTFTVLLTGPAGSTAWTASDGTVGQLGVPVNFGPYPVAQSTVELSFTLNGLPDCATSLIVHSPGSCPPPCDISASVLSTACQDNGADENGTNDVFTATIEVANHIGYTAWTAQNGEQGTYGTTTVGPYPINQGNVTLIIMDVEDASCFTVLALPAPAPCSTPCAISAASANVQCSNNGTPSLASDDTYTFRVTVSGQNTAGGWTASNGQSGAYNVPATFGPYLISGGGVSRTFTDNASAGCTTSLIVSAPPTCSNTCAISATSANVQCSNNGTPSLATDDTYTFTVTVSGQNTGGGWTASNGQTGAYNVAATFGPYLISGGAVSLTFTDNADGACTSVITVLAPLPCSTPFCTDSAACEGPVVIPVHILEPCQPESLSISLFLDAFGDGSIDTDLTLTDALAGTYPHFLLTGTYPIGEHRFVLQLADGCGNASEISIPFSVVDCYVPDPICYSGLITYLLPLAPGTDADGDGEPDDAAVTVHATELAYCLATDCSEPLRFSVNRPGQVPHPDQSSIVLTCADRYSVALEVHIWDSAYNPLAVQPDSSLGGPNYKRCEVLLLVQDPDQHCSGCEEELAVGGHVFTAAQAPRHQVSVALSSSDHTAVALTTQSGAYLFAPAQAATAYTVTPHDNRNPREGVTTLDILAIHRHVLDIQLFHSPYQYVAADVNRSASITALDMVEIRQLILGDIDEFANNNSWRFVDAAYVFPQPLQSTLSQPVPEAVHLAPLALCMMNVDFVAVKVGDVNGIGALQDDGDVESRNAAEPLRLAVEEQIIAAAETQRVAIYAEDLARFAGFQFTLQVRPEAAALLGVEPALLSVEHLGLRFLTEGRVAASWHQVASAAPVHRPLFYLVVQAKTTLRLSEVLSINGHIAAAQSYDLAGGVGPVQLAIAGQSPAASGLTLLQNSPNPFTKETLIGFSLPQASAVRLHVQDASGKILHTISGHYAAGYHETMLQAKDLPGSGVYFYTLHTDQATRTRRLVLVE